MSGLRQAPSEADFFADVYLPPAAPPAHSLKQASPAYPSSPVRIGTVHLGAVQSSPPQASPPQLSAHESRRLVDDYLSNTTAPNREGPPSPDQLATPSAAASRGLHSQYRTTTMMVRRAAAGSRRKGVAPSIIALGVALVIGSVAAVSSAVASSASSSDNTVVALLAGHTSGDFEADIGATTLAGWAVFETGQTSRLVYDPSASELFALLNTAAVLEDTKVSASEALSVQAEMDAIEAARQEAIRRAAAIASAAEIYSASVMMSHMSEGEVAQLAAEMGLQPGDFIIPGVNVSVTSPYGIRSEPLYGYPSWHAGLDLGGDCWQEVLASADGIVTRAGDFGALGLAVRLSHGDISTAYGHMYEISVSAGQSVKQGDVIGYIGNTGYSFGCHIHWQAFAGDTDMTFDPTVLIASGQ